MSKSKSKKRSEKKSDMVKMAHKNTNVSIQIQTPSEHELLERAVIACCIVGNSYGIVKKNIGNYEWSDDVCRQCVRVLDHMILNAMSISTQEVRNTAEIILDTPLNLDAIMVELKSPAILIPLINKMITTKK